MLERSPFLALSAVVLGELKAGFALGSRERENRLLLEKLLDSPRVSVAPVDDATTDRYAEIYRQLRGAGRPIPTNDLWIAACVRREGEALFSYDRDFEHVSGLPLVRGEEDLRALLG